MIAALLMAAAMAVLLPDTRRFRQAGGASDAQRSPTHELAALVRVGQRLVNRRHVQAQARARAVRWIDAVVAELRAGRPPRLALIAASEAVAGGDAPALCPRTAAAASLGGDVASALLTDAQATRMPVLSHVAACWSVAENTGSGLAPALEQVLESARADEEVRGEIEAQLAAPRATARLLAVLPLVGLLLGTSLGAQPIAWLTSSTLGLVVLALGLGEIALGLWWTSRMVSSLEREISGPLLP